MSITEQELGTPVGAEIEYPDRPEGPISAAIIAGGIGALALGVVTTLAEASTRVAPRDCGCGRPGSREGSGL